MPLALTPATVMTIRLNLSDFDFADIITSLKINLFVAQISMFLFSVLK